MDVNQYLEIFLDETKEHLESLNTQILNLEQEPEDADTINEIFRAAHSLKGMAGTMGYKRMQTLTHDMENVFSEIRNGTMKVNSNLIDTLFQCLDALEEYTNNIQETADEGTNDNQQLINQLNEYLNGSKAGKEDASAAPEKESKEASESSNSDEKWKEIKIGEPEQVVLEAAKSQGKGIFGISVFVEESCLLKAARAFQVYKEIEEKAEVIACNPSVQEIEDEKFDLSFSLVVISDYELEQVLKEAKNVSEIEKIEAGSFEFEVQETTEIHQAPEGKEETAVAALPKETSSAPAKPQKAAPAKTNDKKPAGKPVANRTVRVDIEKLDVLMNLVSELIIAKNSMVADSRAEEGTGFREHIEYLESVTTNLHESVMKVRMVPIESVVSKFPRMIRDLSKKLNKKMELYMSGEETELDRTVVDEIGDPLMHLLRNAADHGLESGELRIKRGKPEVGSIFLNAYQDGNNVVIEVKDDGNGIDVESVKNKAIERGVITPEQAVSMSEKDIINLLFHAGFSTAKTISDVSGRGVGLDVVKSKIESLSGEVEVKTSLEEGSTWTIRLPLTLAIIQALMVTVGGEKYAISLGSIQTIEDISPSDVKLVENKEVINLRGSVIPIIRLSRELDIESCKTPDENIMVVIVKKGERYAGLVVDELIGQQEIVIKSLGKYISKCRIISGATILGDGEVALILDANALI
ncbi:chemotaxis protein CheA [Parablautia intestinalis]|jgi:two-component system chemotaxis sensor kinase CheA|uniref:chemotaxis protein CheA n=1 Tax=Parablautia intestinalis TaxID=2320100 RepID=UPI00256E9C1F|nr:chemotaxis protein CheA [Parablautia intestinalis]MCI8614283.1 chemotaxis protein CheA [Lachnospiraceae bacterium]